ncbi:homeobox-domain-containing protein [Suillus clintonianus]|uniref:homeobox-domain-containing protein n=1 Tax=Suillus clintonianus TaxID=1904413 RepID=UPI001B86FB8D|nr:homeobox-domain-containing protein [Suillus clintonianus]KAG2141041.1 homeobox-domain-containing protein [Suillus clintonianus]
MQSATLSRTSSTASISSTDDTARRTRKRFSTVQLMMLEQLFHRTSHPTREEREALASTAGMEIKSVTIWFQNKRQTERKVALHNATNVSNEDASSSPLTHGHASSSRHVHSRSVSISGLHTPRRRITPPRPRPSLDRVAARSESRLQPPRTPTKPHNPHASLWDNMPSSPLAPASPPTRDLVDFVGSGRTLEWACAAARLSEKRKVDEKDVETEEEEMEAITPEGSLGAGDDAWNRRTAFPVQKRGHVARNLKFAPMAVNGRKGAIQDDDMMRAALVLCGLGKRSCQ